MGKASSCFLAEAEWLTLHLAQKQTIEHPACACPWIAADLEALPFQSRCVDALFCANTFQYFPQPVLILQGLARIMKKGGIVAVKDVDVAHITFSPLPVDLAERVTLAGMEAARNQQVGHYHDPFVGRKFPHIFTQAGLRHLQTRTYGVQKVAPFAPLEMRFLHIIATIVLEYAKEYLSPEDIAT